MRAKQISFGLFLHCDGSQSSVTSDMTHGMVDAQSCVWTPGMHRQGCCRFLHVHVQHPLHCQAVPAALRCIQEHFSCPCHVRKLHQANASPFKPYTGLFGRTDHMYELPAFPIPFPPLPLHPLPRFGCVMSSLKNPVELQLFRGLMTHDFYNALFCSLSACFYSPVK